MRGKKKYIESPEKMWELFNAYRKEVKDNPIHLVEQKKSSTNFKIYGQADVSAIKDEIKDATNPIVKLPIQRPLTLEGFENYCADKNIIQDLSQYFANTEQRYNEYRTICARIRRVIRQDQIEGGMAGIYNPSITQRLNNLVDRIDNSVSFQKTPIFEDNPLEEKTSSE